MSKPAPECYESSSTITTDGAMACYDKKDCASMTACYAEHACKHKDMTSSCASDFKVCRVKSGGNIMSGTTSSSSKWHTSSKQSSEGAVDFSSGSESSGETHSETEHRACDEGDNFATC